MDDRVITRKETDRTQWWWKKDIAVTTIENVDREIYDLAETAFATGKTLKFLGRKWQVVVAVCPAETGRGGSITLIEVVDAEANNGE